MSEGPQRANETFQQFRKHQSEVYGLDHWTPPSNLTIAEQCIVDAGRRQSFRANPPEKFALSAEGDYHAQYHARSVRQYLFVSEAVLPGGGIAIEVVAADCSSAAMVKESLLDLLASQMVNRLVRINRPEIGDIVFAPQDESEPSYLLFTKGLHVIQLQSVGGINCSVERFAEHLASSTLS